MIEVLVAMSILLMLVATIIPVDTLMKQERKNLQDRRLIVLYLHDELQQFLNHSTKQQEKEVVVNQTEVTIMFSLENEYIKGCASWKNVKNRSEQICLYGLPN